LASGTSGGVLAYTAAGTLASSAALAASALVIGGGAGAAPSTTTTGTGVVTALGVNTGTAGAFVVNGGALGSPSTAGTIPAFTLGGTVSGGGNQINNVVIGTSNPLAGSFTTVTASGAIRTTGGSAPSAATSAVQAWGQNLTWVDSAQSANARIVDAVYQSGAFNFRYVNDAFSAATNFLSVVGNSAGITSIGLTGNTAVTGTLSATGASTLTGITSIGGIPNSQPTPTGTFLNIIGTGADSTTVPQARINLVVSTNQDYSTWIGGIHGNSIGTDPRILLGSRIAGNDTLLATFALAAVTLPGTLSVGNATPSTSGAGITFPATQSASTNANTLDDYEEGTWTPVLGGSTSQSGQTYTRQLGQYTKVGRQVTVTWDVICTNVGTMVGNGHLKGLPFTVGGGSDQGYRAGLALGEFSGLAASVSIFSGLVVENTTDLFIRTSATASTGLAGISATSLWGNGAQFIGAITYFV